MAALAAPHPGAFNRPQTRLARWVRGTFVSRGQCELYNKPQAHCKRASGNGLNAIWQTKCTPRRYSAFNLPIVAFSLSGDPGLRVRPPPPHTHTHESHPMVNQMSLEKIARQKKTTVVLLFDPAGHLPSLFLFVSQILLPTRFQTATVHNNRKVSASTSPKARSAYPCPLRCSCRRTVLCRG